MEESGLPKGTNVYTAILEEEETQREEMKVLGFLRYRIVLGRRAPPCSCRFRSEDLQADRNQ